MLDLYESDVEYIRDFAATQEEIQAEPMVFSASPQWAMDNTGPLTQAILWGMDCEPPEGLHAVVDTRVHMLMPGMIPAIPGWHCDAIPRGVDGQPDMDNVDHRVRHKTLFFGPAPTEFLCEDVDIPRGGPEPTHWGNVHKFLMAEPYGVIQAHEGCLYEFGATQLHRATPARTRGWRFFFRLSWYHSPPRNEIRNQVQVYTTVGGGW